MIRMTMDYSEFPMAVILRIFAIADLLGVPPSRAAELYLLEKSRSNPGTVAA